jgi:hypothetical protein
VLNRFYVAVSGGQAQRGNGDTQYRIALVIPLYICLMVVIQQSAVYVCSRVLL